jgi:hypothetical protein
MQNTEVNPSMPLEEQLELLREVLAAYRDRESLLKALGTTKVQEIIAMIQSMETQLTDLYANVDADGQQNQSTTEVDAFKPEHAIKITLERLFTILTDKAVKEEFRDIVGGIDDQTSAESLLQWINEKVNLFIERCKIVDDTHEMPWLVMWFYIQLKAEWSQINTEIQYGALKSDTPDMELIFKSSLLSALINIVENIPRAIDVEYAVDFLAEPFNKMMEQGAQALGADMPDPLKP